MARKKASKEEASKVTMDVVVTDELEGVTEESKETKEALTEEEEVVKGEETIGAPVKQEGEPVKQEEESIEESEESVDKGVLSVLEIYPEYESLYVSKALGVYDPKTFKESIDPTAKLYKNPHYKK